MHTTENQSLRFGSVLAALIRLTIVGGLITAVVLMLQRPELPPAPETTDSASQGTLVTALSSARSNSAPGAITEIPWSLVNGALADTMKNATVGGMQLLPIEIKRCYIQGSNDATAIIIERSLFGLEIVSRVVIAPEKTSSGYTLAVKGGSIGRLPIPGKLVVMVDSAIKQLPLPFAEALAILSTATVIKTSPESLAVGFDLR